MKQLLLITAICRLCFSATGQDLKADMTAMNERLASLKDYRISVDYSAGDTADFFDAGTASVLISQEGMFYETEFAEMLINDRHTIIVNEEEKTLIWSENTTPKRKESIDLGEQVLKGIDTLIQGADSVYFSRSGSDRVYHLRFTNSYFDLVELTFNGTYLVRSVYFYNAKVAGEDGVTAISNIRIEENPVYDKQLLATEFYLDRESGNTLPAETFRGYVLIHNTSIESYTE